MEMSNDMSALHSDNYREHLLYAQRLGGSAPSSASPGGENPQEAPAAVPPPHPAHGDDDTFAKRFLGPLLTALLALGLLGFIFAFVPYKAVSAAGRSRYDQTLYWTSGAFVSIAVPVSAYGIVQHLVNFYMPQVQKYVVRILFMVPIFSVQAWISLFVHDAAFYIRTFRELYEAFVLSSFVYYIIELLGGEDRLASTLRTKASRHGEHRGPCLRRCGDWEMGRPFLLNCKYGVLQYVLVKIIFTVVVIVLENVGKFEVGAWGWTEPYTYIAVIMNFSIGYALYCLVKLYYATKDDLKEYHPIWKFLCIKGIIFFTFWQGFLIEVLHSFGVIQGMGSWDSEHVVDGLQDFLISFEMVIFAVAHRYAFPHTDYLHYLRRDERKRSSSSRRRQEAGGDETLFLFDQDQNAVDGSCNAVDVEYEPPTVRQLDRPMGVGGALLAAVPTETISDIARMTVSGSVVVGEGGGGAAGGADGGDIIFSREHAEGI